MGGPYKAGLLSVSKDLKNFGTESLIKYMCNIIFRKGNDTSYPVFVEHNLIWSPLETGNDNEYYMILNYVN